MVFRSAKLTASVKLLLNYALFSDLPNHPKYKTNFPLSLLPKSVVVAVMRRLNYLELT